MKIKTEPRFEDELKEKMDMSDTVLHVIYHEAIEIQKRHQATRDAWILERLHHSLIKVRTLKEWKHDYEHGASMLYNELKKLLIPLSSDVQQQSKGQPMKRKRIIQKSSINRLFGGGK